MTARASRTSPLGVLRRGALSRFLTLAVTFALLATTAVGCGRDRVTASNTPPAGNEPSALALNEANSMAARFERWIATMDPFVHLDSNSDTYTFDRAAFTASLQQDHPSLAAEIAGGTYKSADAQTIDVLERAVAQGNTIRSQMRSGTWRSGGLSASLAWCSYSWWGVKCCYTGADADRMIALLTGSAFISSFWWVSGAILGATAWWCNYMNDHCPGGGFCLSVSWAGVEWVTCRN